jgi:RecB family endonuclease NucS
MNNKPYVWEMVKEAVQHLGNKTIYSEIKNYIKSKYGEVNESTITCQIIVCTVNHATRIHYPENKKPRIANTKYDFLFTTGRGQVEVYDPNKHGIWEIKKDESGKLIVAEVGSDKNPENECDNTKTEDDSSFLLPLESHLRDFIVQNLETIKVNGKTLSLYADENGNDGVEYRTDVGPIDILAVDEDNNFIIFELKVSRGSDRALGQILRYMGWVKKNLAKNKSVHGVIVAKSIDDNLRYASSIAPEITLFEYELDFKIKAANNI